MKEIVIISGKGGTGKTTLTASIVPFLSPLVIADCDVDAPDLHILLSPEDTRSEVFSGSQKAVIDQEKCTGCGACYTSCKFSAIQTGPSFAVNGMKCEGCGVCEFVCPSGAVSMIDAETGNLFHSMTEYGAMKHARLVPGEETSGKLVAKVRSAAKEEARLSGSGYVLIDGSPGIGCNVISSISGADIVVIVTEPTKSGLHDLNRVLLVAERFTNKIIAVINKYDLSPSISDVIEKECAEKNVEVGLKVPFNPEIVEAVAGRNIPSLSMSAFFEEIGWGSFVKKLAES